MCACCSHILQMLPVPCPNAADESLYLWVRWIAKSTGMVYPQQTQPNSNDVHNTTEHSDDTRNQKDFLAHVRTSSHFHVILPVRKQHLMTFLHCCSIVLATLCFHPSTVCSGVEDQTRDCSSRTFPCSKRNPTNCPCRKWKRRNKYRSSKFQQKLRVYRCAPIGVVNLCNTLL